MHAIKSCLEVHDRPLGPKEIASYTGLNRSTVRVYLRQLLREGQVYQTMMGSYVAKPTYGVGEGPPRLHNLRLRWEAGGVGFEPGTYVHEFGGCRVEVRFGGKRRLVTCSIAADPPLDLAGTQLAVQHFRDLVMRVTGRQVAVSDILVSSVELGWDYERIRLDGLSCVTVQSFLGSLERMYNRGSGLRSEVKVQGMRLESVYTLLKGGVTSYNILQGVFAVEKRLEQLTEAMKFHNEIDLSIKRLLKAMLERVWGRLGERCRKED